MIEVNNIEVFNFDGAFRGLRNPMNSWAMSDSRTEMGMFIIGEKDMNLAQRMLKAGDADSKFMRQIFVCMDINAPLFWWKECDQYRVGCTTDSCSTMHKISAKEFTRNDFTHDYMTDASLSVLDYTIEMLNMYRKKYLETKDKNDWRQMIELLPSSYNQKRTWTGSYANLRNIYFQRRLHKLDEWRTFCSVIEEMPYAKELICYEPEVEK